MADCEVNYTCACGKSMPLIYLFFCKYCVTLRCPKCVSHEVDSYYCPHCLENIPSAEAKTMKNRCASTSCLECPNCTNTLQVRSAQVPMVRREGGKVRGFGQFKKVYYLHCSFCFWTTRDINQPDKSTNSGPWIEPVAEDTWMFNIINYYRHLIQKEKVEMEKRKRQRRGSFLGSLGISDKLLPFAKIRSSFSMNLAGTGQFDENILKNYSPIKAEEDTEPADEKYYSTPGETYNYASITSRIQQPGNQVYYACDLKPNSMHLMVKRSQRCRECEHNLSKPEFNPSSIKFKIHQIARRFVPRFRIVKVSKLQHEMYTKVHFSLTNPTEYNLPVEFRPLPEDHPYHSKVTADVKLPEKELVLAAWDDTAQYEDNITNDFEDDPDIVIMRRMNKLTFVIQVKPHNESGDIRIGFQLSYKYKSMTPSIRPDEQKTPEEISVEPCITACLGSI